MMVFLFSTYWTPSTVPSFLPVGSSNWTPHQLPGANCVSPIYCKIPARLPIPDDTITRSPTLKLVSIKFDGINRMIQNPSNEFRGTNLKVFCRYSWKRCVMDWQCPNVVAMKTIECLYLLVSLEYRSMDPMWVASIAKRCHALVRIGSISCQRRNHHFYHWHHLKRFQPNHRAQNLFHRWTLSDRDDGRQQKHVDRL